MNLNPPRTYFSAQGSIRGACGHRHRTLAAANACCRSDHRGCGAQGGYSDRRVVTVVVLGDHPLTVTGLPRDVWTDYPFVELGDVAGKAAPRREVSLLSYDGDKYGDVRLPDGQLSSVKVGYLFDSLEDLRVAR